MNINTKQTIKSPITSSDSEFIKKKFDFKSKLIIFLILIISIISVFFYFYIKTNKQLKTEYIQGIEYIETINKEQDRCSNLLSQEDGKFVDYEYCRQLLQIFPKK